MDACIRSFNDEKEVLAISCVSYLQSTLLDTSKINNTDVDAYIFLLNSQGNNFFLHTFEYSRKTKIISRQYIFYKHILNLSINAEMEY